MTQYTLSDAQDFLANFVNDGTCPTEPAVTARINECQRRLMEKATWKGCLAVMRFRTSNNTITLPRMVEKVIEVNIDCVPRRVWGQTYEFLEHGPGNFVHNQDAWCKDLEDMGYGWPTYFEIPNAEPMQLFAMSRETSDVGEEIQIMGYDHLNMEIRTDSSSFGEALAISRWVNGTEGRINYRPFPTMTTNFFRQVIAVHKPVTVGYISLFAFQESTKKLWLLSKYHPDETVPGYRRYKILGACMPPDTSEPRMIVWGPGIYAMVGATCQHNGNYFTAQNSGVTGTTPPTHTSGSMSDGGVIWTRANSISTSSEIRLWSAGIYVTAGSVCTYSSNYYTAQNTGFTGSTPPTHTSGTTSDGNINWTYTTAATIETSTLDADYWYGQVVTCLVKLQHVDLKYSQDILLIQNLDALKLMAMAIREENLGKRDDADKHEAAAVRLLQEQLSNANESDGTIQLISEGACWGHTPNLL